MNDEEMKKQINKRMTNIRMIDWINKRDKNKNFNAYVFID